MHPERMASLLDVLGDKRRHRHCGSFPFCGWPFFLDFFGLFVCFFFFLLYRTLWLSESAEVKMLVAWEQCSLESGCCKLKLCHHCKARNSQIGCKNRHKALVKQVWIEAMLFASFKLTPVVCRTWRIPLSENRHMLCIVYNWSGRKMRQARPLWLAFLKKIFLTLGNKNLEVWGLHLLIIVGLLTLKRTRKQFLIYIFMYIYPFCNAYEIDR